MGYYPYGYSYPMPPVQGQWMGQGNYANYAVPPTPPAKGNASQTPPLPPLPPPPPPPPPPPATVTYETPTCGPSGIKFNIPSKNNNKLQQTKENSCPAPVKVPQSPKAVPAATSNQLSQVKASSMPTDRPDSLRRYVERCFAICTSSVDKDLVELILKGKITKSSREGTALQKDWDKEPLPNLSGADSSPAKPLNSGVGGFKIGAAGLQTPPFRSGLSTGNSPFKMGAGLAGIAGITALKPQPMTTPKPQISFKFKGQTKPLGNTVFRKKSSPSSSSSRSRSPLVEAPSKISLRNKKKKMNKKNRKQQQQLLALSSVTPNSGRTVIGASWSSP